jgi:predicted transposase/invertase (TIGR01784 family)
VTIELPVWIDLNQRTKHGISDEAEKWNYFLTHAGGADADALLCTLLCTLMDPVFKEAVEFMTEFTRSDELRHAYDIRQNYQHIIASYKRTGFEAGLEAGRVVGTAEGKAVGMVEGKAEGRAEAARETAIKMKAKNLPVQDIADITGLPLEEIEKL